MALPPRGKKASLTQNTWGNKYLPGVQTLGWGHYGQIVQMFHISENLLYSHIFLERLNS